MLPFRCLCVAFLLPARCLLAFEVDRRPLVSYSMPLCNFYVIRLMRHSKKFAI